MMKNAMRRARRRRADRDWVKCHGKRGPLVLHGRLAKAADKLGCTYGLTVSAGMALLPNSWSGPMRIIIGPGVYEQPFDPEREAAWERKMAAGRAAADQLDEELRQALAEDETAQGGQNSLIPQ